MKRAEGRERERDGEKEGEGGRERGREGRRKSDGILSKRLAFSHLEEARKMYELNFLELKCFPST